MPQSASELMRRAADFAQRPGSAARRVGVNEETSGIDFELDPLP